MLIVLQTDEGDVLMTFTIPRCTDITDEESAKLGKNIAKGIMESHEKHETWYRLQVELCTCNWKNQSDCDRRLFKTHSSSCKVWD